MNQAPLFKVDVYQMDSLRIPFDEWLDSIKDKTTRLRILGYVRRMSGGNIGDCKSVHGGIMETRIKFGPGYRIYFGRHGDSLIILLIGGDKSSQASDIEKAREYWKDWKERI